MDRLLFLVPLAGLLLLPPSLTRAAAAPRSHASLVFACAADNDLFTVVSRVLFWTSPILWNGKDFPEPIQAWLYLNPFHFVLDLYRATIWPEALPTFRDAMISIVVIAAIFITGSVLLKLRVNEVRRLVS